MPTTAINAIPYPALTTPAQPDVPADMQAIAEAVDPKLVGVFASAAARAAAIPSPTDGMIHYLEDVAQWDARVAGAYDRLALESDVTAVNDSLTVTQIEDWASPGREVTGLATTVTLVTAGPTTIVAAPSSGRRIIKSTTVNGQADGMTVTLTLAGTVIATVGFSTAGILEVPTCLPIAAGEAFTATVTGGNAAVTVSWADRADTVVDRIGLAQGATSGTLIASGTGRTITQLWIAGGATAGTVTVNVAGTAVLSGVNMPAGGLLTLDSPLHITSSEAVTWAGDGTNTITVVASGH